jgi:hypothetical protein
MSPFPAPTYRDTRTLIPMNIDDRKTMTTRKICQLTPIAAFAVKPTRLPTRA